MCIRDRVEVELLGGSGRASVTSPAKVEIKDGKAVATLEWSSPKYDYMVVDGEKYLPVNTEGKMCIRDRRTERFFPLHDGNNCRRTFEAIVRLKERNKKHAAESESLSVHL